MQLPLGDSLMQQIRNQNAPQAQVINDMQQHANLLAQTPPVNPQHAYQAKLGYAMAAAPKDMDTLQAFAHAQNQAMPVYDQYVERAQNQIKDSMQLRQTAASTIESVRRYNEERAHKTAELGLKEREVGVHEGLLGVKRNEIESRMIPNDSVHKDFIDDKYKSALKARDNLKFLEESMGHAKKSGVWNLKLTDWGDNSLLKQQMEKLGIKIGNDAHQNLENINDFYLHQKALVSTLPIYQKGKAAGLPPEILNQISEAKYNEALKGYKSSKESYLKGTE